jgi:hypothetical protein
MQKRRRTHGKNELRKTAQLWWEAPAGRVGTAYHPKIEGVRKTLRPAGPLSVCVEWGRAPAVVAAGPRVPLFRAVLGCAPVDARSATSFTWSSCVSADRPGLPAPTKQLARPPERFGACISESAAGGLAEPRSVTTPRDCPCLISDNAILWFLCSYSMPTGFTSVRLGPHRPLARRNWQGPQRGLVPSY